MKRWHWLSVALLGVVFAAALLVVPRLGGGVERAQAQGPPRLELDMNVADGNPCNPVDATGPTRTVGDTYKVAICLTNSGASPDGEPAGFNVDVVYNDTLNTCVPDPTDCLSTGNGFCLDSNPDANAGSTTFTTPSLGPTTGHFDCTGGGTQKPTCDVDPAGGAGHGRARISCTTTHLPTLPVGDATSSPIAEVTFTVIAGGDDSLSVENASTTNLTLTQFLICPGGPGECVGGTDHKVGPTPIPTVPGQTPTATFTPTKTPTPNCGREGLPTCTPTPKPWTVTPTPGPTETATAAPSGGGGGGGNPPPPPPPVGGTGPVVSPPSTGDGSGGVPWATTLIWVVVGLGAISLVGGGLFVRRAGMRK
jgi:hypothetical protein